MIFELDIRTLSLVTVLFSLIYGIGLLCVGYKQSSTPGIKHFAFGLLTTGIGFLCLSLRGTIPPWMSIIAANLLIFSGFALICDGISRFRDIAGRHTVLSNILFGLLAVLLVYNTYLHPSIALRVTWISLGIAVLSVICAVYLLKQGAYELPFAQWMTALPFIFSAMFFLFRALWAVDDALHTFMSAGTIHQIAFLVVNIIILTSSFGMLWMLSARLENQLREQAMVDTLTRLFNRRALEEIQIRETARAQRHKLPLTVVMTDIDHFKKVNDVHGHQVGDITLATFASILKNNIRAQDFAVRYGGEEFLMLLPDTSASQGFIVAENLRKAVEQTMMCKKPDVFCTASFGVAQFHAGESWESLAARADAALYAAKGQGRNKTVSAED